MAARLRAGVCLCIRQPSKCDPCPWEDHPSARLTIHQSTPAPCADPSAPCAAPLCAHQIVLEQRLEALQHQLSDASLAALPEFHQRAAVLRQLGYLDADNTVQLKGRVACEINSVQVGCVGGCECGCGQGELAALPRSV
jgi:hypothetical protein